MSGGQHNIYNTKRWRELRKQVIAEEPLCHWCKRRPSTQADHVVELHRNPDLAYERGNLVGSCASCNAKRGSEYQAKRDKRRRDTDNVVPFLDSPTTPTPPPRFEISEKISDDAGQAVEEPTDYRNVGRTAPRLQTPGWGDESYGPEVAAFAKRVLGLELMPWQVLALSGQLQHDDTGRLYHREALVSTARQQGKTVAFSALVGWWLVERARQAGPQHVVSTAHKLDRATAVFQMLAPILETGYGAKVAWSYGRNVVTMPDGSTWHVNAATPTNAHGGTYDLVVADEIWSIGPEVIFDAYRPAMIARPSPLLSMWSTAGDESSKAMMQLREQGMRIIESGDPAKLYFAEWSPPPGANLGDPGQWGWANPALGITITPDALQAMADTPDRQAFLRAHCNVWVAAVGAWLPPGLWSELATSEPMPAGGVLAVDSSLDDLRYVGVRAVQLDGGAVQIATEFVVDSAAAMWEQVGRVCADPAVQLAITPGLSEFTPPNLARRMVTVGQQEMARYTPIVKNMITERRVAHGDELALNEHVTRAVAGRTGNSITLTSQKSPGPIELARCAVWAIGLAAKPVVAKRAMMGSAKR